MHGWGPRLDWEHLQNWVPGALGVAAVILLVVVAANSPTQTNSKPAELPSSQSVVLAIKGQPGPIPAPSQPTAAQNIFCYKQAIENSCVTDAPQAKLPSRRRCTITP